MHCTRAYVKKNICFTGSQFSYSDYCMHVSHKIENCQKKKKKKKPARKEAFCNGHLNSVSDFGRIALFSKKIVCYANSTAYSFPLS